jgi:N-acetylmuramoyl-L-alanine amidase
VNYRVANLKRRIRIWGNKLVAAEDTTINFIKAVFYQLDPHPEWDWYSFEGWPTDMPPSAVLENAVTVKIIISKGKTCSEWYEYDTPLVEGRAYKVFLLPVEVVELSPKLPSEANETVAVPGSEIPQILPESNPLVERDPLHNITDASTRRIAWRDLKVKIGSELSNKTVTWRMTPQFTPHIELGSPTNIGEMITVPDPNGPRFRGSWEHAENEAHQNAFSASEDYGSSYNWNRRTATTGSTPGEATTKVHDDGYTAIRVNVPPIGFNKARVSIQIEGSSNWIDLIDLEVPAVVVIDPGHGGADGGTGSISRKMTEAQVVLDVALKSESHIRNALRMISPYYKILFTRKVDVNVSIDERVGVIPGTSRQGIQRYNGADVFLSIHCNSGVSSARRVETNIQWGRVAWGELSADAANQGNYSHDYDNVLGQVTNDAVFSALRNYDHATTNRGVVRNERYANGPGVLRDSSTANGNNNTTTPAYHPLRSALVELEFISNADGDALLISGKSNATLTNSRIWSAEEVREDTASGIADAIEGVIVR